MLSKAWKRCSPLHISAQDDIYFLMNYGCTKIKIFWLKFLFSVFFTSIQTLALGFYIYLIQYIFVRFLLIPQTYSGGHLTFYGKNSRKFQSITKKKTEFENYVYSSCHQNCKIFVWNRKRIVGCFCPFFE